MELADIIQSMINLISLYIQGYLNRGSQINQLTPMT